MKFVDRATITVAAGNGGPGCSSFRREKFVPKGGPDGGDGGLGGDVVLEATDSLQTLMDLVLKRRYQAPHGEPGRGKQMFGLDGEDIVLRVPCGTVVYDEEGTVLADLIHNGDRFVAAKGGKGGRGNVHFATSVNRTPRYAQPGLPGEEKKLQLELKLLAQIGLVGLPNAGKSTLLKALTRANPKIADYPFTTLYPNLGVLKFGDREWVLADIPGLIEGAAEGVGLGTDFLRHVDRTQLMLHVVAIDPEDPQNSVRDFEIVGREIAKSMPQDKPVIVVLNKADMVESTYAETVASVFREKGFQTLVISALAQQGIGTLIQAIAQNWQKVSDDSIQTHHNY